MFYTAQLIISISFICKPQRITLQRLDFHPMQTSGTMLVVVRIGAQCRQCRIVLESSQTFGRSPKLYIPSTLNIDLILWHTQLIVCAVKKVKSQFKSWVISFTFQAYTLPHTLICICVSLSKFHI